MVLAILVNARVLLGMIANVLLSVANSVLIGGSNELTVTSPLGMLIGASVNVNLVLSLEVGGVI